jgi:hypothetical protein
MEVDYPRAPSQYIRHNADIRTVMVESRKVMRESQIGPSSRNDEVLIKRRDAYWEIANTLVFAARRIGYSYGQFPRVVASAIAAECPIGIKKVKFTKSGFELPTIIFQQQNVLMAQDDEIPSCFKEKGVVSPVGLILVLSLVVDEKVFAVGSVKPARNEGGQHLRVLVPVSNQRAYRKFDTSACARRHLPSEGINRGGVDTKINH